MPELREAIESVSVVIAGQDLPVNFLHPSSLKRMEVLSISDLDEATVLAYVPDDYIKVRLNFGVVDGETSRIVLKSLPSVPIPEKIRDMAVSILAKMETGEVGAFGINHDVHFPIVDQSNYAALRSVFIKPEIWSGVFDDPLVNVLTVRKPRDDGLDGHVIVKVEPSVRITVGMFATVNDHYDVKGTKTREQAYRLITSGWEASAARASNILSRLRTLGC